MKKVLLIFLGLFASASIWSQDARFIKDAEVDLSKLKEILDGAYITAQMDNEFIKVVDRNLTVGIKMNSQGKNITFFAIFPLPQDASVMKFLQIDNMINEWSNTNILPRVYMNRQQRYLVTDHTMLYEGLLDKFNFVVNYRVFVLATDMFMRRYGPIIADAKMDLSTDKSVSLFIDSVLEPGMDGSEKTVTLENDDSVLTLEPDMIYRLSDKKTGRTSEGRHGFVIPGDSSREVMFYLYESDVKSMSRSAFLASDYQTSSGTIMVPVFCDGKQVVFKYVKPDAKAGKTVTFSISEPK